MDWAKNFISDYFGSSTKNDFENIVDTSNEVNSNEVECLQCNSNVDRRDCYNVHNKGELRFECIDGKACYERKIVHRNKVIAESRRHLGQLAKKYKGMNYVEQFNERFKHRGIIYDNLDKEYVVSTYSFYKNNKGNEVFVFCEEEGIWLTLDEIEDYPHLEFEKLRVKYERKYSIRSCGTGIIHSMFYATD